ncbi:hypothetical protein, conserved [Angomonas deanei]|uniref:Uncharacterized protein n=1 Tax=Angomonas deanei TaxID=59799 RepID=A0A7G2CUN1_9TRYP|nr:hypothetical protein, conserved [Angomonas deanei]
MRGKAYKKTAEKSFKRWQNTRFSSLLENLPAPITAALHFPVQGARPGEVPFGSVTVHLSANAQPLMDHLHLTYHSFYQADYRTPATVPLAESEVRLHVGPPQHFGYPTALELEGRQWCEAVWRSEAAAYQASLTGGSSTAEGYLPPTRWVRQGLLDGFVTQRVTAHTGVTTADMLHTHDMASQYGHALPPFDCSPYYGGHQSLRQWCLFGEGDQLDASGDHVNKVLALSYHSSVLAATRGVWLRAAVVTSRESGKMAWIVGPRGSGKTTLALHCLAAHPELELTASEDCVVSSGSALAGRSGGNVWFAGGMPSPIKVGLGAVLGSLSPNAFVGAHHRREMLQLLTGARGGDTRQVDPARPLTPAEEHAVHHLLQNPESVLWSMAKNRFVSHLQEVFATQAGRHQSWRPAHVGPLAGIILLNWHCDDNRPTGVLQTGKGLAAAQSVFAASEELGLFKDHYLLRSEYDVETAPDALQEMLEGELDGQDGPKVYEVRGDVDFSQPTALIHSLLK